MTCIRTRKFLLLLSEARERGMAKFGGNQQNLAEISRITAKFGIFRRRRRRKKFPMCQSKGHRLLWGRCPKREPQIFDRRKTGKTINIKWKVIQLSPSGRLCGWRSRFCAAAFCAAMFFRLSEARMFSSLKSKKISQKSKWKRIDRDEEEGQGERGGGLIEIDTNLGRGN